MPELPLEGHCPHHQCLGSARRIGKLGTGQEDHRETVAGRPVLGARGWPEVYAGQTVTIDPHREHIEVHALLSTGPNLGYRR